MLRTLAAALFGATLGIAVLLLQPRPVAPHATPAPHPTNAREQWAVDLLARLGNTLPSADTLAMVVEWTIAEDGGDGALARNNALNTTLCLPGAMTGAINGDGACGVQGYATWQDGIEATARTIEQGNFSAVRAALLANDAEGAREALWASPWAESHYGYGAIWPAGVAVALDIRAELVSYALSLQGIPYVRGGRSASGGDCSGTMQYIYLTITGRDIGATTFSQWPALAPVEPRDLLPGDLWFGQFSDDQHVGMLCDCDGDGALDDLIHNGADAGYLHVTTDFLSTYLGQYTMGYRRAV